MVQTMAFAAEAKPANFAVADGCPPKSMGPEERQALALQALSATFTVTALAMFPFDRRACQKKPVKSSRQSRSFRPSLEILEDRLAPAVFTVTTTADELTPGDGLLSLREAINLANSNPGPDTILLGTGLFAITKPGAGENANASGDFDIKGDLTLIGIGAVGSVVTGNGLDRVFDIPAGFTANVAFVNLGIIGGLASGAGALGDDGAFNAEGGNVTLLRTIISGNVAGNGNGGGFSAEGAVKVTITNSTIRDNRATGKGGGFTADGLTLTMSGSSVYRNFAGGDGGGAFVKTSGTIGGSAGSTITNCTFSANKAAANGGGIDFEGNGDLTIINATIAFNLAFQGGGISQDAGTGTVHMGNTILFNRGAPTGPDAFSAGGVNPFDDLGHNLIFSTAGSAGLKAASDIIGQNPLLGPLANNGGPTATHALLPGSPAINKADDALAPPADQRGVLRPQGPHSDIGAFEAL